MENNQESSGISNVPITPKTNNSLLIVIIGLLLLLLMGLGVLIVVVLKSQQTSDKPVIVPEKTSPVIQEEKPTNIPTPVSKIENIAYIKDYNVYVISSDGLNKKKLTSNNNPSENSFIVSWKNNQNLTYNQCKNGCVLKTYNLETKTEKIEANPGEFAGETQINALSWNHKGDMIAFIYKLPDGKERLAFKSGTVQTTIKEFKQALGRGGSFDDNVNIEFSPDDSKVLVTNTGQLPNAEKDKNSIWVFENTGKEIISIGSDEGMATQAKWIDNNSFIYKQGKTIQKRIVTTPSSSEIISDEQAYDPTIISDGKNLAFWTVDETLTYPSTKIMDLETKVKIKDIKNSIKPYWISNSALIMLNTTPNEGGMVNFDNSGLSLIDINSGIIKKLDSGNIFYFIIQP